MRWIEQICYLFNEFIYPKMTVAYFCKIRLSTNSISIFHFTVGKERVYKTNRKEVSYSSATHFFLNTF